MEALALQPVAIDAKTAYETLARLTREHPGKNIPTQWVGREHDASDLQVLRALEQHVVAGTVELVPAREAGRRDDMWLRLVPRTARHRAT